LDYEALAEVDLHPDWVAGISIGAINSAIIAGNPREARVAKLREFWELVSHSPFGLDGNLASLLSKGDAGRALAQQMSTSTAGVLGVPGFYTMRFPSPLFQPPGTLEATSFCDTTPLKATLERLVERLRDHHDFETLSAKITTGWSKLDELMRILSSTASGPFSRTREGGGLLSLMARAIVATRDRNAAPHRPPRNSADVAIPFRYFIAIGLIVKISWTYS
jgi:predicted acylesterase/phospholipase RssA